MFVLLAARGCLHPEALSVGPDRKVGLGPYDLLIAFGLMILGPALLVMLLPSLSTEQVEGATASAVDTLAFAKHMLLSQASGQLPPVLYLLWRSSFKPNGPRRIGLIPSRFGRDVRWGLLGFLAAVPMILATIQVTVLIGEVFGQAAPSIAHDALKMLIDSNSTTGTILIIFSAALVAPVLEEGLFRGMVQSVMVETLGNARRWAVVIVASFVFALMHANLQTWDHWQALPGLFVLGLVLGWLYERSGSLWPGIVVHMGFNILNIVMALAMVKQTAG